jgi:hypothetical protein
MPETFPVIHPHPLNNFRIQNSKYYRVGLLLKTIFNNKKTLICQEKAGWIILRFIWLVESQNSLALI